MPISVDWPLQESVAYWKGQFKPSNNVSRETFGE
jgi:hypothetical protein